jgi:hypothetical protein
MKRGRTSWTARVAPRLVLEAQLAMQAGVEGVKEVYSRLGLCQRVKWSTFRHWATVYRREHGARLRATAIETDGARQSRPRGRWGSRGIRRLRQQTLDALADASKRDVLRSWLVASAERLIREADTLVDLARLLEPSATADGATTAANILKETPA